MNEDTDALDKTADVADADKVADAGKDAGKDTDKSADTATDVDAGDKSALGGADADTAADAASDADKDKDADKSAADKDGDSDKAKADWPDEWRDFMAKGDEDIANAIKRYGSPHGVAKALKEAQTLIRSGKVKRDQPDPSDEKAMAEWRKEQGIPDEPTGYELPETVTKRMTDEDKPVLASFTEFMHGKNASQDEVARATEWYVGMKEQADEQRANQDREAAEAAEEALRKDWPQGEYKPNLTLAKRFMESVPEVGENWSEARLPDGRRLGDIPDFVAWASDRGREQFGDATFASGDSERKHTARKDEIEKVMKENIDKYYEDGLDKEYAEIIEKEQKRASR